jgi:cytochrome c oxidase assembly factor CtaG
VPALYDLTLRNSAVHELEHVLFVGTALLLWVNLLPGARTLSEGARVAYGTGALLVSWVLAVVLGLATHPLYSGYPSLSDQQLAAGIMWVPGSIPFCVAIFVAGYRWLDPAGGRRRRVNLRPMET